jgi:hypothetical protein
MTQGKLRRLISSKLPPRGTQARIHPPMFELAFVHYREVNGPPRCFRPVAGGWLPLRKTHIGYRRETAGLEINCGFRPPV